MMVQHELEALKRTVATAGAEKDRASQMANHQNQADKDRIDSLERALQAANADKNALERQLADFQARVDALQAQQRDQDSEKRLLQDQVSKFQQQALSAQDSCDRLQNEARDRLAEIEELKQAVVAAAMASTPPPAPAPAPAAGGMSVDDMKQLMQEIYVLCGESFHNDVDVSALARMAGPSGDEIGAEFASDVLQQVTKLHLKRLRETIRHVSSSKM